MGTRDGDIARIIVAQQLSSGRGFEKIEGGETGQLDLVVKDQACFKASVTQEQSAAKLWQIRPVFAHYRFVSSWLIAAEMIRKP